MRTQIPGSRRGIPEVPGGRPLSWEVLERLNGVAGVIPWARLVVVDADGARQVLLFTGDEPPGLALVQGLARLQLLARRAGGRVWLEDVSPALGELLELTGLRREVAGQVGLSGRAAVIRRAAAACQGTGRCRGAALLWEAASNRGTPLRPRDPFTPGDPPAPEDPAPPADPLTPGDPRRGDSPQARRASLEPGPS